MQLSVTERERLYAILEKYDQNPKVQQMRFTGLGVPNKHSAKRYAVYMLTNCWLTLRRLLGGFPNFKAIL